MHSQVGHVHDLHAHAVYTHILHARPRHIVHAHGVPADAMICTF
jgi:hypothetical protein